jgi:hypothetical protein
MKSDDSRNMKPEIGLHPKPQVQLPIPMVSDRQRRLEVFARLQDERDTRAAAAFWSCSGWQHGHHIDCLPIHGQPRET